ncbi:hypothetical protein ACPOL_0807 [Acidisarcina polymorpha]|uniref:Uncharacterized protein n=1 Tax=Acidisarcina polymorpha TaxID=2211140 RepID=A0A2Z5FTL9_9BACT|nr:hypothetical protein ACPOL_0807 [Acidisarcina polymorpha]
MINIHDRMLQPIADPRVGCIPSYRSNDAAKLEMMTSGAN